LKVELKLDDDMNTITFFEKLLYSFFR